MAINKYLLGLTAGVLVNNGITNVKAETKIFDLSKNIEVTDEIEEPQNEERMNERTETIVDAEALNTITEEELILVLKEKTQLDDEKVYELAKQGIEYRDAFNQNKPIQEIKAYSHTTFDGWESTPTIIRTTPKVAYSDSNWTMLNAYRSPIGITGVSSQSTTISARIGFTGSAEIQKFKASLTAEASITHKQEFSSSMSVPGWTVGAWRAYILYEMEEYSGRAKYTDFNYQFVGPSGAPILIGTSFVKSENGINNKLRAKSTEAWSARNTSQATNISAPIPPHGTPRSLAQLNYEIQE